MPNHLKFCSCRACRAGKHTPGGKAHTRLANRRLRHKTKTALKKDKEPPAKQGVEYTD